MINWRGIGLNPPIDSETDVPGTPDPESVDSIEIGIQQFWQFHRMVMRLDPLLFVFCDFQVSVLLHAMQNVE
jgi:hypothetical protein